MATFTLDFEGDKNLYDTPSLMLVWLVPQYINHNKYSIKISSNIKKFL